MLWIRGELLVGSCVKRRMSMIRCIGETMSYIVARVRDEVSAQ